MVESISASFFFITISIIQPARVDYDSNTRVDEYHV